MGSMSAHLRIVLGLVLAALASVACSVVWTLGVGDRLTLARSVTGGMIQGGVVLVAIPFLQGIITASVGRLRGPHVLIAGIGPLLNAGFLALISIGDPEAGRDLGSYGGSLVLGVVSGVLGGFVWRRWVEIRQARVYSRKEHGMRNTSRVAVLLVVASSMIVAAKTPGTFEEAMQSAQKNVSTPEGKAFDRTVGIWFGERHAKTMDKCTEAVSDSELVSFDLLMRIGADGHVAETAVRPETKVATCVRHAVEHDMLSRPPKADYWVHIAMSLKP